MRRRSLAIPALIVGGLAALLYNSMSAFVDVPVRNWRPPALSFSLPGPLSDLTGALPFVGITPCRIVDTRGGRGPWTGAYGPPALVGGVSRTFNLPGGPCSGIPATAAAYSLNLTAISAASAPAGSFLTAWPTGSTRPIVSTLIFGPSQTIANAAIVPAGSGAIDLFSNWDVDVVIDINGYFADQLNTGIQFALTGRKDGGPLISATNTSPSGGAVGVAGTAFGWGVKGTTTAGGGLPPPAGVKGVAPAGFNAYGVLGEITGTIGYPSGNWGVVGAGFTGGVYGTSPVPAGTSNVYGVLGEIYPAASSGLNNFGVFGKSNSSGIHGAGVAGKSGFATLGYPGNWGVVGGGVDGGVYGVINSTSSLGFGVHGALYSTTSFNDLQGGFLGYKNGATIYGVYSTGDMGATGIKPFVEPHPSDPQKVIRYVALEGPEAGTYFRGTSRTSGGEAVIDVPESFRIVTAEEGITVQVTPVGELATMAVMRQDLNQIVIRASKDVAFHYQVNGVRRAFRDHQAIAEGSEFKPSSANARLPQYLPDESKRRLVTNGTYNEDGTVNQRTASRVGWTREWEEKAKALAAAEAAEAAAAARRTPKSE